MTQKNVEPNLMGSLFSSAFKAKLNEMFTLHNQILKDGQELLSLCQSNGFRAMGKYVQTFVSLLSFISMKEEYAQKVDFFHGLYPWACNAILQILRSLQHVKK
jgi:hypothetical protein